MLEGLEGVICNNYAHLGAAEAGDNNLEGIVFSTVLCAYRKKYLNILLGSLRIYEKRPNPIPPFYR